MHKNIAAIASLSFLGLVYCTSAIAELRPFHDFSTDEYRCGYKNDIGKIVIPVGKYDGCGNFSDGLAYVGKSVLISTSNGYKNYKYFQGFLDETGDLVIPIEHEAKESGESIIYKSFSEGLVVVLRNDKYGYMNKMRDLVIPYQYEYADEFKEGLAIVRMNGRYGAIDSLGKTIIPIKFKQWIRPYSEGLAIYAENNHWNDGLQYGFINKEGNTVIKPRWDEAYSFSEGLAAVKVGDYDSGKWGIIDTFGNYVVKPKYDAPIIQVPNYIDGFDGGHYKDGKMYMYDYTVGNRDKNDSDITRYTLNRQGKVVSKKFYSNWDAVVKEYHILNP